jgi:hypothetical protein
MRYYTIPPNRVAREELPFSYGGLVMSTEGFRCLYQTLAERTREPADELNVRDYTLVLSTHRNE